jgi:hypothetical protein
LIYAYSRLSKSDFWFTRLGGDGLGNLLYNWARCLARADEHGWQLIWPTWRSFKPKNWRVNPYDHRLYADLFRPTARYLSGPGKPWVLATRRWVGEAEALASPPADGSVVQFRGMGGKFAPFLGQLELVRGELLAMTRPEHLAAYRAPRRPPVGIHVRRGDFLRLGDPAAMECMDNTALPIEWYVAALRAVRARVGETIPARVFSDGTGEELAELLAEPAVEREENGSAISDLLALSRSRLLIASGSTFSMWASYLHQVPTLWHPGKLSQRVHLGAGGRESEWAPERPLPDWVSREMMVEEP